VVDKNPASIIVGPKLSKRLPEVVRSNDLDKGLSELNFAESFSGQRDALIFHLLYQTGTRRSELIEPKS